MTGFRIAPGGARERFDVEADLTTLGKVIGGGLPVAAYGGRRALMELVAPAGPVYQAGTLSGNPLAMAAGIATLTALTPALHDRIAARTWRLVRGLREIAARAGVPFTADCAGSMWGFFFRAEPVRSFADAKQSDTALFRRFFHAARERGVLVRPMVSAVAVSPPLTLADEHLGLLADALRGEGVRVAVDSRVDVPFGRRAVDAELKGYPVRIEVGPRELAAGNVIVVRRFDGSKTPTPVGDVAGAVAAALDADQQALYDQALAMRESGTADVTSVDEAIEAAGSGWARLPWSAVGAEGETRANAEGVTVRCLTRADGSVPDTEDEPDLVAYLARAY
jgi:hypothetical protein